MKKLEFVVELRDKMSRALENIKRLLADASGGARGLASEASRTGDASAAVGRLEDALDEVSRSGDKAAEAVSDLGDASDGASKQAGTLLDRLKGMEAISLNNLADLAGRIGDMMASATTSGMGFGQAMADLSSITGIAGDDLANLEENARRLGAESGLGADTAARAYSLLASQIDVASIGIEGLNTLQQNSVTLAQASGMSLDDAANALAGTINQFGLGADSASRVINVLAAGSKYGAAEISELSQSFKVVGAAASAMGMNVEDTAGALEVLSKANLKGGEAGTALRNIILKLNTELGIDLGETSLGTALEALKPKLSDTTYLAKLFGAENIAAAQFLIQNAEAVDLMTDKVTDTSVAQEQAAIRTDTTANRMQVLRAQVDEMKIGFTDMLGSMAPYATLVAENAEALSLMGGMGKVAVSAMLSLNAAVVKATGSTVLQIAKTKLASAATAVWTVAQKALNLVLTLNPIGLVIAAIAALVAGIAIAYNHFEGFREVCDKVWEAVKQVAAAVWDYLVAAFERASEVIQKAWQWLKNFFGIEDASDAEASAEAIDKQTDSIKKNTDARKGLEQLKTMLGFGGDQPGVEVKVKPAEGSIEAIETRLRELQQQMDAAPLSQAMTFLPDIVGLEKQIAAIRDRLDREKFVITYGVELRKPEALKPTDATKALGLGVFDKQIEKAGQSMAEFNKQKAKSDRAMQNVSPAEAAQQGINGVSQTMQNLSKLMGEGASAWMQYAASVLSAVASAIPAIVALTAAKTTETGANTAAAASGAAASVSSIPIVGPILAVAAVTSVLAALAAIPKFAAGGIAYGPTLGLFGEYAGAASNPEVVAPLDRLRALLDIDGAAGDNGRVEFRIKGRALEGVLSREQNRRRRLR